MNAEMKEKFLFWISEREKVRNLKEANAPKPWTQDKMLQTYRFCNVYREDDKVSRWIYENWIAPNEDHPNLIPAIVLARMVNWPDTLAEIGFPSDAEPMDGFEYADRIRARINRGDKTWTGAYMITAEMDGTGKEVSVMKTVSAAYGLTLRNTCRGMWEEFQSLPRIGSFMAAQFVADLKRTHLLGYAPDVMTFCAPGPGSQKGLNLLLDTADKQWSQPAFQEEVNKLRDFIPLVIDAQNTQNCLCEFSKYIRGSSRSKYPGAR